MVHIKNILVSTDFSPASLVALEEGAELAARFGACIHLLHVIEDDAIAAFQDYPFGMQTVCEHMTTTAEKQLADIQSRHPDLAITPHIRQGQAAAEILSGAEEVHADMIVMATHGRSGLARLLVGSVTEQVVRQARCAVLTVRTSAQTVLPEPASI